MHVLLLAAFLTFPPGDSPEDVLKQELRNTYENKILTLRDAPEGDKLRFQADGSPVDRLRRGTWLANSKVRIDSVKVDKDSVRLKGERLISFGTAEKPRYIPHREAVEIELEIDSVDPSAVHGALRKIFANANEVATRTQFAPHSLRDGWEDCYGGAIRRGPSGQCLPPELIAEPVTYQDTFEGELVYRHTAAITVPSIEYGPDPQYPEEMRKQSKQAVVVLFVVLSKSGKISLVKIAKTAGEQFDLAAVAAVTRWRLKPATLRHQPVNFAMNIEIKFRLY
jgi:TonB family protein